MIRKPRLVPMIPLLLLLAVSAPPAAEPRRGIDLSAGAGITGDPSDDDVTSNYVFGAGYRGGRRWAIGLDGTVSSFVAGGKRLFVGPYAKVYPLYNPFVNPYGRVGFGLGNVKVSSGSYAPGTRFNLTPVVAGGLELGYHAFTLFGEISHRLSARVRHSTRSDGITSLTVGVSLHILSRRF